MQTRVAIYHSHEWGELVEQGWVTHYVYDLLDLRVAVMVWTGRR